MIRFFQNGLKKTNGRKLLTKYLRSFSSIDTLTREEIDDLPSHEFKQYHYNFYKEAFDSTEPPQTHTDIIIYESSNIDFMMKKILGRLAVLGFGLFSYILIDCMTNSEKLNPSDYPDIPESEIGTLYALSWWDFLFRSNTQEEFIKFHTDDKDKFNAAAFWKGFRSVTKHKNEKSESFKRRKLEAILDEVNKTSPIGFLNKGRVENFYKEKLEKGESLEDADSIFTIIWFVLGISIILIQGKKISRIRVNIGEKLVKLEHRGPYRGKYKAEIPFKDFLVLWNETLIKESSRYSSNYYPGFMFTRVDNKPLYGNVYEVKERADNFDENKLKYLNFLTDNFERF